MTQDYGNALFQVRVQDERIRYTLLGWFALADVPVHGSLVDYQRSSGIAFLQDSLGQRTRLRGIGLEDLAKLSNHIDALQTRCGEMAAGGVAGTIDREATALPAAAGVPRAEN